MRISAGVVAVVFVVTAIVVGLMALAIAGDGQSLVDRCAAQGMSTVALGRAGSVCVAPDGALYIPKQDLSRSK